MAHTIIYKNGINVRKKMTIISSSDKSNKLTPLILICFFLSGITGLIYEVLWVRMIVKVIGAAPFAVSIILTVFMGGLGLGSYIASRVIDRIKEPLKLVSLYGKLELIIGIYAVSIPLLLMLFEPIYSAVYNRLFDQPVIYHLLTFLGCSIILCVPVICMGATLPILCRFYVTKLSHLGTHTGRLYGLNTIGAAAGSLLCGFWLINLLGVYGTMFFAAAINVVIGLVCIIVCCKSRELITDDVSDSQPVANGQVEGKSVAARHHGELTASLIIFAISGFCAMAYEVIWTKLLGLIVAPTTYSFTIVLFTFITGLAMGSMFFGWLGDRVQKPIWLLILTQTVAALLVLFISQLFGNSQLFFAKIIFTFKDHFMILHIAKAGILFAFMILPTICLGATFPLVGKIYTQSISKVGKSIGFAYAINTIGAVAGSFCAGFILVPLIGKEKGLSMVIALQLSTSLVIAIYVFAAEKKNIFKFLSLAVPSLAGMLLCLYFPMWNHRVLAIGKYQRFEFMGVDGAIQRTGWLESIIHGSDILSKAERGELMYYGEGIGGFTTVMKYTDAFGGFDYTLANSGKPDASAKGDLITETLFAHIPMLLHKNPKTVMVLGLASGITAGEILNYPIEKLDVIDISHQVAKASKLFTQWNNNVLFNANTRIVIQDGRAHLQLTKRKYDVIISEPSNPWMAGLASLFTRDFFVLANDRLNDDGIFVQFLHSYQMDWPAFSMIGRTFSDVFPNSLLMSNNLYNPRDYFLVGFKSNKKLELTSDKEKLQSLQKSKNIVLANPKLFYRYIVCEDLKKLFGGGLLNTDNRPYLEFSAPKLMYLRDSMKGDPIITKNVMSKKLLSNETWAIAENLSEDVNSQIDFAAFQLSVYAPFEGMVDLTKASKEQKERFFKLMENYCANNQIDYSLIEDEALRKRCSSIQIKSLESKIDNLPDKGISYFYLGYFYYADDMLNEAVSNYRKSLQFNPENAEAHDNIGIAFARLNKLDDAVKHFTEASRLKPDMLNVNNNLGYTLACMGRLDEAITHFNRELKLNPNAYLTYYHLAKVMAEKGQTSLAIINFKKAIQLKTEWTSPMNDLAWLLSTNKNPAFRSVHEAIELAERTCKLTDNKNPEYLATLAAAYASARRFSEAVTIAQKAMDIAKSSGDLNLSKELDIQLQLYRAGKPFIDISPKAYF